MGRYFGIKNVTKGHAVSEGFRCWKAYKECDIHEVMHRYGWDPTDQIFSSAYDSSYSFYPAETVMIDEEDTYKMNDDEQSDDTDTETPVQEKVDPIIESKMLSFRVYDDEESKTYGHYPVWIDGKCKTCEYVFDPKDIDEDEKSFDKTFYMN